MTLTNALRQNDGLVVPISIRKLPRLCPDLDCSFPGQLCRVCKFETGLHQRERYLTSSTRDEVIEIWVNQTLLHVGSYEDDPTPAPSYHPKPTMEKRMTNKFQGSKDRAPSDADLLDVMALELQKCSARLARASLLATWLSENCSLVHRYQQQYHCFIGGAEDRDENLEDTICPFNDFVLGENLAKERVFAHGEKERVVFAGTEREESWE